LDERKEFTMNVIAIAVGVVIGRLVCYAIEYAVDRRRGLR